MFCPNCGANLPEGTTFCGNCGAPQRAQQPQQAPVQQPVYQAPPQPQYQPQPVYRAPLPVSKKDFLAKHADAATKQAAKLSGIVMIVALVLLLASIIAPLAQPFYEIPAISTIITLADADVDELTDELESSFEEAEYRYDMNKDAMDKDERDAAKQVMDKMEALVDNFSILNFQTLVSVTEKVGDDYMDSSDLDELEEINQIMGIIIAALVSSFLLPVLFTVLGGLNKSTGLAVAATIFTALSQLTLCGFLFVVLSLAVNIFQILQCSKIQKAYQTFRTGRPA